MYKTRILLRKKAGSWNSLVFRSAANWFTTPCELPTAMRIRDSFRMADNQRTGGVSGNKGAFLGIGRTESLCLKRVNHVVEKPFSKAFIKRSVTLQPSEEQGTTKHIDQQFRIGRRLQFA